MESENLYVHFFNLLVHEGRNIDRIEKKNV